MSTELLNEYCKKLSADIKDCYLQGFSLCENKDKWPSLCQDAMRNFVSQRTGWQKDGKADDVFLFSGSHPITINILYSGSPGMLMVNTATEIAKAELLDKFGGDTGTNYADNVMAIVKCIESQDWLIPFLRRKNKV